MVINLYFRDYEGYWQTVIFVYFFSIYWSSSWSLRAATRKDILKAAGWNVSVFVSQAFTSIWWGQWSVEYAFQESHSIRHARRCYCSIPCVSDGSDQSANANGRKATFGRLTSKASDWGNIIAFFYAFQRWTFYCRVTSMWQAARKVVLEAGFLGLWKGKISCKWDW